MEILGNGHDAGGIDVHCHFSRSGAAGLLVHRETLLQRTGLIETMVNTTPERVLAGRRSVMRPVGAIARPAVSDTLRSKTRG